MPTFALTTVDIPAPVKDHMKNKINDGAIEDDGKVTVIGSTGRWFKVSVRGKTGYIMKQYVGK